MAYALSRKESITVTSNQKSEGQQQSHESWYRILQLWAQYFFSKIKTRKISAIQDLLMAYLSKNVFANMSNTLKVTRNKPDN